MEYEIQLQKDDKNGRFYIDIDGENIAEMTFVFAGNDSFIIDHTGVNPSQEGKGLGKKLLVAAIDFARKNNYKIIPLCPFAKRVIDINPDYHDIVKNKI
jgi:predicted GNAT family acetyltransferase